MKTFVRTLFVLFLWPIGLAAAVPQPDELPPDEVSESCAAAFDEDDPGRVAADGLHVADVIPGDEICKPWEHWEGGHSGSCEFGCRCAAPGAGLGDPPPVAALALVGFGALLWVRRRR